MTTPDAPTLSVVVTTHDDGPWIREALESLTAQTYGDLEILVVDDASSDETATILDELAARDARIRLLRSQSPGRAAARDLGSHEARGLYLIFCRGDDIVPAGACAELMARTAASPDVIAGDFLAYRPNRTWHPARSAGTFAELRRGVTIDALPQLLRHRSSGHLALRREAWLALEQSPTGVEPHDDLVPVTRALLAAGSIDVVTGVVRVHRVRDDTSSPAVFGRSLGALLEQELVAAGLVEAHGSSAVAHGHDVAVVNGEVWDRLAAYLRRLDGAPADPAVAALLVQLLGQVGDDAWSAEVVPQLRRRWALALAAGGRLDVAAQVLRLTTKGRVAPDPVAELVEWADALEASASTPGWRGPALSEIHERWVPRRVKAAGSAPEAVGHVRRLEQHRKPEAAPAAATPAPEEPRGLLGRLRGRR